jgi:hypothetical protein
MGGYVEMKQPAPLMAQNDEDKQDSKTDSVDNEEISGDQVIHMITEEGAPRLRGRFALANHVLGHRRLRHLDAELEELTMATRSSPEGFAILIFRMRSRAS